jgi:hypothetical protein
MNTRCDNSATRKITSIGCADCCAFARPFVAVTPQPDMPTIEQFLACRNCTRKAAGFVPKLRLGEMYAAKNYVERFQKLLPVVGLIGYARY